MPIEEVLLRLGATFAAVFVIGLERESRGRVAGLRTVLLVGLAAAAAMVLSESLVGDLGGSAAASTTWRPDPARLAAAILTGMGFLGAGAVLREGNTVRGLTTAATLWAVSLLGLVLGAGHFVLGGIVWSLLLLVLFVLPAIEALVANDWYATLDLRLGLAGPTADDLARRIERHGVRIKHTAVAIDVLAGERRLKWQLKFKKSQAEGAASAILADLSGVEGVRGLAWE